MTSASAEASIADNGAVLLGKSFTCDAHTEKPVRIVTHAHADHISELRESLQRCNSVIMTPATRELAEALYGLRPFLFVEKLSILSYKELFKYGDEKVTLFNAGHIIGSAQVLVEDSEGGRVVYTGDFKLPEAEIIPCDVLVMEATYGHPSCVRPFRDKVEDELVKLVKKSLESGPTYIFGYHGKLQEVIGILRKAGITAPIVMPNRVYRVTKICEKYGMQLGEYFSITDEKGVEAMKSGNFIGIYHIGSRAIEKEGVTKLVLSGWEFRSPYRKTGHNEYTIALSDHSDFDQLIEYVEKSRPKFVITDNYRIGDAVSLAREIKKRLGISAKPMP